jgi:hypothetical protein
LNFANGTSESTSASLIEQAREADSGAWRRLSMVYGPLVYRWCRRAGLQDADAADVLQEVFRAVHGGLVTFEAERGGGFRGWLYGITQHKLADHFPCAFGNGAKSCGHCWWVVGAGGLGSGAGLLGRPWNRGGRGGRGCALADDWEGSSMAAVAGPQRLRGNSQTGRGESAAVAKTSAGQGQQCRRRACSSVGILGLESRVAEPSAPALMS